MGIQDSRFKVSIGCGAGLESSLIAAGVAVGKKKRGVEEQSAAV